MLLCAVFTTVLCVRENRLQHSEVSRNFREAFKRDKGESSANLFSLEKDFFPSFTL